MEAPPTQEEVDKLKAAQEDRKHCLEELEKELERLKKQQGELERKKRKVKDGNDRTITVIQHGYRLRFLPGGPKRGQEI